MRLLLALPALLLAAPLSAQVNTEDMRRAQRSDGVGFEFDATGAYATGNTNYLLIGLGSRVDVALGADEAFVVGRFQLSEADGTIYRNQAFAHARYNNQISPLVIGEVFVQAEQNRQQLLEQRYLLGSGVRLQFVRSETAGLALGLTPMFEYEQLSLDPRPDAETYFRVSSYLSARLKVSDAASLSAVGYVQPRMDDFEDLRVLGQSALDLKLTRHVSVAVRANLRYDSRPPDTIRGTDFSIENGLTLRVAPAPRPRG
jgi:hypothetical protein